LGEETKVYTLLTALRERSVAINISFTVLYSEKLNGRLSNFSGLELVKL